MISSTEQESDPFTEIVEELINKANSDIQKRKYYKGRFLGKGDFSKCYELTCSEKKKNLQQNSYRKITLENLQPK